jgi:dienelactone hydrolase
MSASGLRGGAAAMVACGLVWLLGGPAGATPRDLVPAPAPSRSTTIQATEADLFPPAPLHEQVLSLPGDPARPVALQVTLFTPDGPGPFPLAVLNHGANGTTMRPADQPRYRATFSAFYFLSRGYAVALPMMRGYAGSGGTPPHNGCDVVATGLADARDIVAVIDSVAAMPMIDPARIVVAGQSFGGWNTLSLGALGHQGVRGLVNFAGGMRSSDCGTQDAALETGAAFLGGHTSLPSIWFYGDNDQVFPPVTWHAMFDQYTSFGGHAELVDVGTVRDDSHQMLSDPETLPIWTPKLDAFLRRIGLPAEERYPAYLPIKVPAASGYAAIDDANAVPFIGEKGRQGYRDFLQRKLRRAFVIAPNGTFVAGNGGFDPVARTLARCQKAVAGCQLYAVDNVVVWSGQKPSPPVLRATVPAGATARLNFVRSVNPDCSSRGMPKVWLVQAPAHGAATVAPRSDFPRFPANNPLATCNAVRVPGQAVEYAPTPGFSGADSLTFETITLDNRDLVFRVEITVK